jgi:hypothetical protein
MSEKETVTLTDDARYRIEEEINGAKAEYMALVTKKIYAQKGLSPEVLNWQVKEKEAGLEVTLENARAYGNAEVGKGGGVLVAARKINLLLPN